MSKIHYVNSADVMNAFLRYLKDYDSEMISKQVAVDELQCAIDSAKTIEVEAK